MTPATDAITGAPSKVPRGEMNARVPHTAKPLDLGKPRPPNYFAVPQQKACLSPKRAEAAMAAAGLGGDVARRADTHLPFRDAAQICAG